MTRRRRRAFRFADALCFALLCAQTGKSVRSARQCCHRVAQEPEEEVLSHLRRGFSRFLLLSAILVLVVALLWCNRLQNSPFFIKQNPHNTPHHTLYTVRSLRVNDSATTTRTKQIVKSYTKSKKNHRSCCFTRFTSCPCVPVVVVLCAVPLWPHSWPVLRLPTFALPTACRCCRRLGRIRRRRHCDHRRCRGYSQSATNDDVHVSVHSVRIELATATLSAAERRRRQRLEL